MSRLSQTVLLAAILAVCLCNVHLNIKYRDFVDGKGSFELATAKQIYSEFRSAYTEKSSFRFNVFVETLKEIREHNSAANSWRQGLNDYSDMTFQEFTESRLMTPQNCSATNQFTASDATPMIPSDYEWNTYGMVTPVKNQGACGSCWTFSTIGAMESHWNILGKGKNLTFSEQQLVDCAGSFENFGCKGGLPSHAFEYIKYYGLESDITYPYQAKDQTCTHRTGVNVASAKYGSFNITQGDQAELAERLYNAGPISISFQVINGFKNYAGGVYSVSNCGKTTHDVNHAVLATGYGVESGNKFWNIKNSWGPSWGAKGYFKMARGVNMCAVGQCNSYPLINEPKGYEIKME